MLLESVARSASGADVPLTAKMTGFVLVAALMAGAVPQESRPDFDRDIRPIFQAHCISCHGAKKMKGQLRLDSKTLAFRGGVSGKVLVPGKGKESRLVEAM